MFKSHHRSTMSPRDFIIVSQKKKKKKKKKNTVKYKDMIIYKYFLNA